MLVSTGKRDRKELLLSYLVYGLPPSISLATGRNRVLAKMDPCGLSQQGTEVLNLQRTGVWESKVTFFFKLFMTLKC